MARRILIMKERLRIFPDLPLGLALGDTVWGFELIEIQAEKIIFRKGASEVELGLDFTRNHINVKPARSRSQNKGRRKRAVRKGK